MGLLDNILGAVMGKGSTGAGEIGSVGSLQGILGMLTGGRQGAGGLSDIVKQFSEKGLGDVVGSWVGTGENKAVSPDQLSQVLGEDKLSALASRLGLSRSDGRSKLADLIPQVIDKLTPNGKIE